MLYCSNCGKQIPASSKFCAWCGHAIEVQVPEPPLPNGPEVVREFNHDEVTDSVYRLLDAGDEFNGYIIVRLLNKDPEGIKYIAEKNGSQFVLKLFFKYKFSNLDSIISLQNRLKRLNKLDNAHTAKVVEINQHHDPAYMAAEFVSGMSLATAKATAPNRLSEPVVRAISIQLVQTAIAVRKQGLTLYELTPSGIMIDADNKITVLSSGIRYEEVDEREEVFNLGVIMAQLLSRNVLYKVIYNKDRLQAQKFSHLNGVSQSLNKVLAECLQRNLIQRNITLLSLLQSLENLPPLDEDEILASQSPAGEYAQAYEPETPMPVTRVEWPFFLIVGLVVAGIVIASVFVLPRILRSGNLGKGISDLLTGAENPPSVLAAPDSAQTAALPGNRGGWKVRERTPTAPNASGSNGQDAGSSARAKSPSPIPRNFASLPAGNIAFSQGGNKDHNVSLGAFSICRYEVTQAEWSAAGLMLPETSKVGGSLPVDKVSWIDAIKYCNERSLAEDLTPCYTIRGATVITKSSSFSADAVTCDFNANGYRLPTEAEWEYAAKAGADYLYSGSNDLDAVAWVISGQESYHSGGGKKANGFGLYDLTGNVGEWCWDRYDAGYPASLPDGTDNPTGPASGSYRVIRGVSVSQGNSDNLKLLTRAYGSPARSNNYLGFRLVRKF